MLPPNVQESVNAYAYVANMMNVAYLTGFVRKPHANGFLLQQTNNLNHAIPIFFEGKHRKFVEGEAITVICHGYGVKTEAGDRSMELKAIKVEVPTLLTMPSEIVWNSKLPDGMEEDSFRPFGNGVIAKLKETAPAEDPDHVNEIFNATGGRFEGNLGAAGNVFRCAGFVEAYAMARDSKGQVQDDCLTILVRQLKDPDQSLPVRVYGKMAKTYMKHLSIGRPVRIDGQVRVNAKAQEDGSMRLYTYIHTAHVRNADKTVGIKKIPTWYVDMKARVLSDLRNKTQPLEAKEAALSSNQSENEDFDPDL